MCDAACVVALLVCMQLAPEAEALYYVSCCMCVCVCVVAPLVCMQLAPDTEASPRHSDDSSDLEASPSLGTERATSVSFKLSSKDKRDDARGPLPGMPGYKRAGGLLKSKKSDGGNSDGPALLQRSASGEQRRASLLLYNRHATCTCMQPS